MPRTWLTIAISLGFAAAVLAQDHPVEPATSVPRPAVFSDVSFADGVAANKKDGKVFVVKATAAWCGPCKAMNRTTMVDPRVVKWFGDNGAIIEFDVDKDRELAKSLNISAMPTAIAFKGGKEYDRVVGLRPADSFIEWLDGVKSGKKFGDDLQVKIEKANAGDGEVSVHERLENARTLLGNRSFDKAADEYLWLWQNMLDHDPAMVGVRGSFMAGNIKQLIDQHPPAKDRFAAVRDQAWTGYLADPARLNLLDDWLVLNEALGDEDRTVQWFDRAKAEPAGQASLERVGYRIEPLLNKRRRIADICRLYPNPIEKLRRDDAIRHALPRLDDDARTREMTDVQDRMFRGSAATLYTSLLLAGYEKDAAKLAAEAIKLDDTGPMRVALVRTAVENNAGRPLHADWLKEADKAGEATEALAVRLRDQTGKP